MFDKSACLKTSTCQYSVIVVAPPAGNSKFGTCKWLPTVLQTVTKSSKWIFSAGASKFCEQSHWQDHRVVQLVLPFLLQMRNIKRQTKQKRNKIPLLIWAAQRGPFISSDRDANKLVRAQNSITREPKLISWHCYCTVLRDPLRSVWIHCRINKDCCEIYWEAFIFCTEICYKQIKRRWRSKPEAVTLTVTMVL